MAPQTGARARRDRWADWAVIAVVLIALSLGWGLQTWVEGQRTDFTSADGKLTVSYPPSWLLVQNPGLEFEARDPASGGFKTTYQIWSEARVEGEPVGSGLAAVLTESSLNRAQEGTAYRLLNLAAGRALETGQMMEAEYVFVQQDDDPLAARIPVVVHGLDVALQVRNVVYVFTLLAEEVDFGRAAPEFRRFVETAEFR